MKTSWKIVASIAVVAAGAGLLVYSSLADAQPYEKVDQLMASPSQFEGKTMRIHGFVEPGSIHEQIVDQQTKRTFILQNQGKRILVRNEGPKPDTFRDEAEVVAKGRLALENGQYVFHASELMAKCPSKYQGAPSGNKNGPLFSNSN